WKGTSCAHNHFSDSSTGKPLKRLKFLPLANTRLKPGVNETRFATCSVLICWPILSSSVFLDYNSSQVPYVYACDTWLKHASKRERKSHCCRRFPSAHSEGGPSPAMSTSTTWKTRGPPKMARPIGWKRASAPLPCRRNVHTGKNTSSW